MGNFHKAKRTSQHCAGAMATEPVIVLPGDEIDESYIPSHPKKPLRLGPGLQHSPPDDIIPTIAGQLATDHQKNAIRIETSGGRYMPRVGELVIGTVHHSAARRLPHPPQRLYIPRA